jgi:hypothetical protein
MVKCTNRQQKVLHVGDRAQPDWLTTLEPVTADQIKDLFWFARGAGRRRYYSPEQVLVGSGSGI